MLIIIIINIIIGNQCIISRQLAQNQLVLYVNMIQSYLILCSRASCTFINIIIEILSLLLVISYGVIRPLKICGDTKVDWLVVLKNLLSIHF